VGYEIKDIDTFGLVLLRKWKWRLRIKIDGLWKEVLDSKYGS